MYESLGLSLTPQAASLWLGLLIGALFGALAEASRFCLRRALVGPMAERRAAGAVWAIALAVAVAGTTAAQALGWIDLAEHRFLRPEGPALAIVAGGLMFGAGMVLARGCAARLTVLAATGNLRAGAVIVLLAVVAHATMKGVLAPARAALEGLSLPLPALSALPFAGLILPVLLLALAGRHWPGLRLAAAGAAIGALVPLAWLGTGLVLADAFDPIPVEALSFTAPLADTLFWTLAASAIAPGFGTGLVLGTLLGAGLSAWRGRRLEWQGFESPGQMGRYAAGAALMGAGGVLAGGCTLGAGLTGLSTLSGAAALALLAIVAGARLTDRALNASSAGRAAPSAIPAE